VRIGGERPEQESDDGDGDRLRNVAFDGALAAADRTTVKVRGRLTGGVRPARRARRLRRGRVVEFRVMMWPLQGIQAVHEQMGRSLAAGG
jgi:hypothetical protein